MSVANPRQTAKMQQQVLVLNAKTERQQGRTAQLSNILAGKAVADLVRTCLGPQAMLKMLMDPMGGIVLTSDGNSILREIDVAHPAAKTVIEVSRAQDEEVGDGTTSVVVLTGEMLAQAASFFQHETFTAMHPITVINAYRKALEDSLQVLDEISKPIPADDDAVLAQIVQSTLQTKAVVAPAIGQIVQLAIRAVRCVCDLSQSQSSAGRIDLKRFARVEKVPGGQLEDSSVLQGVMLNKDIVHPAMKRMIKNPRVLLLDSPLEYKKGESQTSMEISGEQDWSKALELEEMEIKRLCDFIIALKPDVVVTEKGLSDLAQHFLVRAGITALRRVRKTDNQRIARACGARIVSRVEDAVADDLGLGCGEFRVEKIGDEWFTWFTDCTNPKACTILLRGPSKDVINEVERALQDAMCVARNLLLDPRVVPGAGACEIAASVRLTSQLASLPAHQQPAYKAVARAFEVLPRALVQNCGADPIRLLSELRARVQQEPQAAWGIDGITGRVEKTRVMEPLLVKSETWKSAIETACLLLRVDEIVSGVKNPNERKASNEPSEE